MANVTDVTDAAIDGNVEDGSAHMLADVAHAAPGRDDNVDNVDILADAFDAMYDNDDASEGKDGIAMTDETDLVLTSHAVVTSLLLLQDYLELSQCSLVKYCLAM